MRISFLTFLDSAFTAFLSFICLFLILNFYIEQPYSIIFGACIAVPIFLLAFEKNNKRYAQQSIDKQKNKTVLDMCNALCLLDPIKTIELFERAINRRGFRTIKKKGGIYVEQTNAFVFIASSFDGITKTDVVRAFNKISAKDKVYIFGESASTELLSFIGRFNQRIVFVDANKTYELLNSANCLPKETILSKTKPNGFGKVFSRLFVRKNSKKFLGFGFFFLFMSAFVVIKIYYIICACIFITLSLFCRLFGKEEIKG